MVTVNELRISQQLDRRPGLLSEWVEQDLADVLAEYGVRTEDQPAERIRHRAAPSFGYGVPMAGVRYYTYYPEA